ncbi:MAG: hypothetical protein ACK5Y6_09575 [Pseudomonadota bacterium]|jgi:hypothetical protein
MYRKIVLILSLLVTLVIRPASAESWEFVLAPYGLLPNISGDASLGRIEGADVDLNAGDVLDSLELGFMMQGEARHKSGFGVLLNYAFMKLGQDAQGPAGFTNFEADIFQGALEGFGTYRIGFAKSTLDLYAGVRWWDINIDIDANTPFGSRSFGRDQDWVDPVVGLRWIPQIADSWRAIAQADIGGFDVASKLSWAAQLGAMWDASDSVSLVLMYRLLSVDYSTGERGTRDRFEYDTITQGPLLGAIFRF